MEVKIKLFKVFVTQLIGVIFGVIHTTILYQKTYCKLYSDTFKRLINVPRYTCCMESGICDEIEHITDHFIVIHKDAYSLISRVTAFPNSIVTAIVNSNAYHQTPLMDKSESI